MEACKKRNIVHIKDVCVILTCIACVVLAFSCNYISKETEDPSKDVKDKIAAMEQWLSVVETSKDSQIVPLVNSAVHRTGRLWQEFQNLITSGQVRLKPWQGADIASETWDSPDDKVEISLTFRTEDRLLSECKKRVYSQENTVEQFYRLTFYKDSESIKYCELDKDEFLWFYPRNKIRRYSRRLNPDETDSEIWYSIEWDQDGKIINELTQTFQIPEIQLPARNNY